MRVRRVPASSAVQSFTSALRALRRRAGIILRCACLLAICDALLVQPLQPQRVAPRTAQRAGDACMMGRKFENNKLKMAKTALAYAKKASYVGKKVVVAVKAGGDDPSTNLQLAKVLSEANSMNVPKDVIARNIKKAMDPVTADYKELTYEAYGAWRVTPWRIAPSLPAIRPRSRRTPALRNPQECTGRRLRQAWAASG